MREGFAANYGSEHEGKDSLDNLASGSLMPDKGSGRREAFAAAYGTAHEGFDSKTTM